MVEEASYLATDVLFRGGTDIPRGASRIEDAGWGFMWGIVSAISLPLVSMPFPPRKVQQNALFLKRK